ncbi:MAG TPA: protein-L-isoaspartate(D-aspartate) O-methyltransferase [Solirubrobacteraceae bacterium]|nr:protein-L-isoaspartate(D-aspartate) O-methyltransferase [Solirubrobacteraceae bacterium]
MAEGAASGGGDATDARSRLLALLSTAISDRRVLEAVATVDRERFVPEEERAHAWANEPLPIGWSQTISQPLVAARMAELLELGPGDRVLDVGTGSGYHAALLAALCDHVWSIERHAGLSERAAEALRSAGVDNVTLVVGDGSRGHPDAAPYDAINVAAASWRMVPPALEQQLAVGGRMIVPVARRGQRLVLVRRTPTGIERRALEPVRFVELVQGP